MFSWIGAITYSAARAFFAVRLALGAPRLGGRRWAVLGQGAADVFGAAFPIAFVSHGFRSALGLLWVPMWLFAAAWEGGWLLAALLSEDEEETALQTVVGPWKAVWGWCFVLPSLIAGGLVAFDAVAPHQWPLGGEPPPFACAPTTLRPRDTLTLTMEAPHGGELGVFTPSGRYLFVVPFAARSADAKPRFDVVGELRLPTTVATGSVLPDGPKELIFGDPGRYQFQLSQEAEVSASRVCRVLYLP